jgi:hypothetical protein
MLSRPLADKQQIVAFSFWSHLVYELCLFEGIKGLMRLVQDIMGLKIEGFLVCVSVGLEDVQCTVIGREPIDFYG